MNKLLFTNLEADDAATIQRKVNAVKSGEDDVDDIFDRGSEEEQEDDDAEQKAQKKVQEQEIAKKRDEKYLVSDDQEVNLDDL
jgi:hypothetical protein